MIKLENIQKVFRTEEVETVALGGVSLEVKKGEHHGAFGLWQIDLVEYIRLTRQSH